MSRLEHIVIVGASLAGLRAAESLRERGFGGRLTIIGEEPHEPYDRPSLSKQVALGMVEPGSTTLPRQRAIAADWRLGAAAARLDRTKRVVLLADGRRVAYDRLLVATGARATPWCVASEAALRGVLTLRTRDDAARLRLALLARPRRVVVIGGGFNGSEVASACRTLDIPVTLIEREETPLANAIGCVIGRSAAALQRANGVDLRCGASVERLEGDADGHVRRVYTVGSAVPIEADLVLVALGTTPNVEWLAGSNLAIGREGLACDDHCRALDRFGSVADGIFVAGDVARFALPLFGDGMRRVEHWSNAVEQGRIAAANMLLTDDMGVHAGVPTFWSSQFDVSIKAVGLPSAASEVSVVQGSLESGCFVALYGQRGRLVAAVTFDQGKWLQRYVPLVEQGAPFPCPGGLDSPPSSAPMPASFPEPREGMGKTFVTLSGRADAGAQATAHRLAANPSFPIQARQEIRP